MIKSLYVHIPFCLKKCLYCDFNSYTNIDLQNSYLKALEKELLNIRQTKFETIFIGGGTPTILSINNLEYLLGMLKRFNASEFTIECNPGTLNGEKLKLMKDLGVNRLSIGLQAWQNKHLESLGRIHNQKEFIDNYKLAREYGFDNINIDLMFGIPNQTLEEWKETICNVIELKPEHLSCYGLIIEEGTPFYSLYEKGFYKAVDEDVERQMYYFVIDELKKNNYKHYEISNFAFPKHECRHNITYWKNEEYYGIGAGAHSYINKTRYSNVMDVEMYITNINKGNESWIENRIAVTRQDEISEYMFLGLRLLDGINKEQFKKRFDIDLYTLFGDEINELKTLKLIKETGNNIALTSLGVDLSNQVFLRFIK
jgi:oxygen-independent coproporphyrinogen III oxidase